MDIRSYGITVFIGLGRKTLDVMERCHQTGVHLNRDQCPLGNRRSLFFCVDPIDKVMVRATTDPESRKTLNYEDRAAYLSQLEDELDRLITSTSRQLLAKSDNTKSSIFLDVIVAGNLSNLFYLEELPKVCGLVSELVHGRYDALFRVRSSPKNASFHLLPVAFSENLRGEPHKRELLSAILGIEQWHRSLPPDRQFIPRFYAFDGFARGARIGVDDQIVMISDFIMLLLTSGLRNTPEVRRLIGFGDYPEDFISILSMASLQFPTQLVSTYCCSHALLSLFDALLESPRQGKSFKIDMLFEDVSELLTISTMQKRFAEASSGFNQYQMIADTIPTFHVYPKPGRSAGLKTDHLRKTQEELSQERSESSRLSMQGTYLPQISFWDTPEVIAEFYSASWQRYPRESTDRTVAQELYERFASFHESVDSYGMTMQEEVVETLRESIDKSLQRNSGRQRISQTIDYLSNDLLPDIDSSIREWDDEQIFSDLPNMPGWEVFEKHAETLRKMIWQRAPVKALFAWLPVLFMLFFFAFYHLVPFAVDLLPTDGGDDSASSPETAVDGGEGGKSAAATLAVYVASLRGVVGLPADKTASTSAVETSQAPAKFVLGRFLIALGLSALFVIFPLILYHMATTRRIRMRVVSEYPQKAKLHQEERKLTHGIDDNDSWAKVQRNIEKLDKRIYKRIKKRGILARTIANITRDLRIFQQSRLRLTTAIWIRRILLKSRQLVQDEIDRLSQIRRTIDNHRAEVLDRLRRMGDSVAGEGEPVIYPTSTIFHSYLLGDEILSDFVEKQRSVKDESAMIMYFVRRFHLLSPWREHSPLENLDVMYRIAHTLYPVFDEGMFSIKAFTERLENQLNDYMLTLEERLTAGDQFRFFSSLEENTIIFDSGIHLFCHPTASAMIRRAMSSSSLHQARLIENSANPDMVMAIRILQDIEGNTLANYLGYDLAAVKTEKDGRTGTDVWHRLRATSKRQGGAA